MRNSSNALLLVFLAACSMQSSLTGDTTPSSTSANGGPRQYADQDEPAPPIRGALVRSQLDPVRGMSLDAAKAYLRNLGHDGEVAIREQYSFQDSCGLQKVCDIQPESGTGIHDRIELVINPGADAEITVPE